MSNNVSELFSAINAGRLGKNKGISTGIPKLDSYIGGLQKKTYYLIFSDSGGGKTAISLYMLYRCLVDDPNRKIKIAYFSLEMSSNKLLAKLLGLYLYEKYNVIISYKKLMSWEEPLSDEYYQYVLKGKSWLEEISKKLIIYDKSLNRDSFYRTMMELLEESGEFLESEDGKRRFYKPYDPELMILGVVDHLALCSPKTGETKKSEMDAISAYAVNLRERCGVSWFILQQANRGTTDMDRRKAELYEPSRQDLKDTECPYNDSDVCIGIFNPVKLKLKTTRGYTIIVDPPENNFYGLRDRYRGLCLIKNRDGDPDRYIPMNFFGEISYWRQLPKAEEITDYSLYLSLNPNTQIKDDVPQNEQKKELIYNF